MGESPRQITNVLLSVAADLGHGGPLSEYRIDAGEDGYSVTLTISKPFPSPGESPVPTPPSPSAGTTTVFVKERLDSSRMTEVLSKERGEVEAFLGRLSAEFNVYGLSDLKPSHPFLHPTFYSFSFLDAAGEAHGFEYRIECSNHLDERYRRLVEEFEGFFESGRVFEKFFDARRRSAR